MWVVSRMQTCLFMQQKIPQRPAPLHPLYHSRLWRAGDALVGANAQLALAGLLVLGESIVDQGEHLLHHRVLPHVVVALDQLLVCKWTWHMHVHADVHL